MSSEKNTKTKKILLGSLALIALAGVGVGGYFIYDSFFSSNANKLEVIYKEDIDKILQQKQTEISNNSYSWSDAQKILIDFGENNNFFEKVQLVSEDPTTTTYEAHVFFKIKDDYIYLLDKNLNSVSEKEFIYIFQISIKN